MASERKRIEGSAYELGTALSACESDIERVGSNVEDLSGNAPATLEGFVDNDDAWRSSQTGEPSMTHARPRPIGRVS